MKTSKSGSFVPRGSQLRKLLPYLGKHKGRIILSIVFLVSSRLLSVADPQIIKRLIDELVAAGAGFNVQTMIGLVVAYFVLRWGASLLTGAKDYIFAKVETQINRNVSLDVFSHLISLPVSFHSNQSTGDITRKIARGVGALSQLNFMLVGNVVPTVIEVILIIGIFLFTFPISFSLTFLGFVVLYVIYTIYTTEARQGILLETNRREDAASSESVDAILNYETVKYFTNEKFEEKKFRDLLKSWQETAIVSAKKGANLNMGQVFIITAGLTALIALSLREFQAGGATIGDFVLVTTYLTRISIPLNFLGFMYRRIKEGIANVDAMFALLDEETSIQEKKDAIELTDVEGAVTFTEVDFSYEEGRQVLHDINIDIPAHKRVALVGYSGSGKSTISKLLVRFYDPQRGHIYIDDTDIKDATLESVRQHIGVVAQDTVLFNDTIANNIRYGKLDATDEEIKDAAQRANIHEFITKELPDGYDTTVGERGVKLSGGEKQRVAIARMLLKNPPILVFDEATASLDSRAEKIIQDSIQQLAGEGRTMLVIAHRLSTIKDFDNILVFESGRIVEQGTHDELVAKNSIYKQLWEIQQKKSEQA